MMKEVVGTIRTVGAKNRVNLNVASIVSMGSKTLEKNHILIIDIHLTMKTMKVTINNNDDSRLYI